MSRSEVNIPEWDQLVEPIVKATQEEVARKVAEQKRLEESQLAKKLAEAQEVKVAHESVRAERWNLLEGFNPRALLEGLNRSESVWRNMGVIKAQEGAGWVEYCLNLAFSRLHFTPGNGGEWPSSASYYVERDHITSIKIGVTQSDHNGINNSNRPTLRWENNQHFQGRGYGLYVYDTDTILSPVDRAETFKDVIPNLGEEHYRSSLHSPYSMDKCGVIVDTDHLKAKEILIELLARSCINRAKTNSLPWQMQEGEKTQLDDAFRNGHISANDLINPLVHHPPKPQGFWSKLFGS